MVRVAYIVLVSSPEREHHSELASSKSVTVTAITKPIEVTVVRQLSDKLEGFG